MPAAEPHFCVAQVSEETVDAWRDFCDRYDINRTVLADVIGMWFQKMLDTGEVPPLMEEWIEQARDLKNQRRRRG